jgi:hypothetical protein
MAKKIINTVEEMSQITPETLKDFELSEELKARIACKAMGITDAFIPHIGEDQDSRRATAIQNRDEDLFITICDHESAHIAMRWVQGLSATDVLANDQGGFAFGDSAPIDPEKDLLFTLAGFACECGCMPNRVNLQNCSADDFDRAKEILKQNPDLRNSSILNSDSDPKEITYDVEEALELWFERACNELLPHLTLVEWISEPLQEEEHLSEEFVQKIFNDYEQYIKDEEQ